MHALYMSFCVVDSSMLCRHVLPLLQVTTIDQKTLKSGKEPMQTLSGFRSLQHLKDKFPESKYPSKAIFFGNLCAAIGHSIIRVGDTVSADMRDGRLE